MTNKQPTNQQVKEYVKGLREKSYQVIAERHGEERACRVCKSIVDKILTEVLGDLLVEVETIRECADEDGVIQKYHDHQTIKLKDAMKEG